MLPLSTLHRHAIWYDVLKVFGLPVNNLALPARTRCPHCRGGSLTIYEDSTTKGAWHYCFQCHASGDMISLAADIWDVSTETAIYKLAAAGVPLPLDSIDKDLKIYNRHHSRRYRQCAEMFEKAKHALPRKDTAELAYLRRKLHLNFGFSLDRWAAGPGNLVGVTDADTAFTAITGIESRQHRAHFFTGPNWRDVVVVPYHSPPGRFSGFLFVGRRGEKDDHRFMMTCRELGNKKIADAGLAGMWSIENDHRMFGEYILAVEDPFLMLRLQIKHFAGFDKPLPIVSWRDDIRFRTMSWTSLGERIPVLWCWKLTSSVLNQAIAANGRLVVAQVDPEYGGTTNAELIHGRDPYHFVRRIVKRAKPWQEALNDWAKMVTPGAVEDVIMGMEAFGRDPQSFGAASEVIYATRGQIVPRKLEADGRLFTEQDGKLWAVRVNGRSKTPVVVLNAYLRIDERVVCQPDIGIGKPVPHYRGTFLFDGQTIPFNLPVSAMQSSLDVCLTNLAARYSKTYLYVDRTWKRSIVTAAIRFGKLGASSL